VPEPDAKTQHTFDEGMLVDELARQLFPNGSEIPFSSFQGNISVTKARLKERRTLFQAGIMADNIYSRLDVLRPAAGNGWDIVEIKSSTRTKPEYLQDMSFQLHCCRQSHLEIKGCHVVHLNGNYRRNGEIDPAGLFIIEDITAEAEDAVKGIDQRITSMLDLMQDPNCPENRVGTHCGSPRDCLVPECREALPDNNVLHLYRGGKKGFELLYRGVRYLREIPDEVKLTANQQIQRWCDDRSCAHTDGEAIRAFLSTLEYPVHYLDFETFSSALPPFDGTQPYQNIPFQFSVQVVDRPGAMPWPHSYLHDGNGDPRPELANRLRESLGDTGSIVAYNAKFEGDVLNGLGEMFPEHRAWTASAVSRLVDLLKPFRDFHYYHPDQRGSASMKTVLPALTGRSYAGMEIADGNQASLAYWDMRSGKLTTSEKTRLMADLEKYCGQDTDGMISIVHKLRELCGAPEPIAAPPARKRRRSR
jgi:hypothetical protein